MADDKKKATGKAPAEKAAAEKSTAKKRTAKKTPAEKKTTEKKAPKAQKKAAIPDSMPLRSPIPTANSPIVFTLVIHFSAPLSMRNWMKLRYQS